jgi:hypothetical protein
LDSLMPVITCALLSYGRSPTAFSGRTGLVPYDEESLNFKVGKFSKSPGAATVYVTQSVRMVDTLTTILAPTLCVPHTAQQLHEYLGFEAQLFGTQ